MRELWIGAEAAFAQLAELAGHPAPRSAWRPATIWARRFWRPCCGTFSTEAPVRFEIVTTHSREGVRLVAHGDVDLAVVTGQDTPRGLEAAHLFDQPFAWVGPRRRRGERATLTERLRREPILRLAAESRGRAVLDRYLADARIRPVSTIDVPSVSLLLSYVSGGLGIGLVPALALREAPGDRVVSEPARVPPLP